ncbi:E3 ubiquitin-protein ligase TRIM45-like isoform X1 [Oculina patagonica]
MESLLKNLKKQVTCSICLDTYTKPKTITCLHTFCLECLKKHALTSQRQGKYRCPNCQEEVGIPEGNCFDKLPTSFLHNSLLSLLAVRQIGDGSEISCGTCKKKSAEIGYCFDCEKLLCPDCVNAHEVFQATAAAFEGHKVTPVKQFQAQDYEALLKRKSFCSQKYHEREVTKFFCLECQTCVCQVCINTVHKNHNIDPLEKAADGEKANIMAGVKLMKEKRKVFSDVMRQLEDTASKLEDNVNTAIREVSQAAEEMIATIREREQETITALKKTRGSRTKTLDCAKKQMQSSTKRIDQAVEFANNLVRGSSDLDIMQSNKNLEQRFEDLNKTPVPAVPVSSFVKFVSTIAPESLSLGFVATSETDERLYSIEGLTENFQAGLEAEFVVCPNISEELTSEGQRKFHVGVLVGPSEKVESLIVCKREDGNFKAKFIPKVPGSYNITVKINGDKLANSPFTVQVKERQLDVVGELDLKGEIPQEPHGIAVNSKRLIAVADGEGHCVLIFNQEGKFVRKIGCCGKNPGQFIGPAGVTYLNDDEILVADDENHRIQQFNVQTGNFVKSFGKQGSGEGEFKNPESVCMDGEGRIVVADYFNNRIQVLTKDGKPVFKFGGSSLPTGCICHKNRFIVSDFGNDCLKVFDCSGKFLYKFGKAGEAEGQLSHPWGLCVEKYGNRQNLLVCDSNNGRIQQFTMEGCFTGKTVTGLQAPTYIATTPDGRILVSDCKAQKIYVIK